MLTKRFAKYYSNALGNKNDIVKYVFKATAYTPGSVTSNNIKMLCDAADQKFLTSLEHAVKCDFLGDEELGHQATFIQELCMVRDGQLFVEVETPDIGDTIDHLCLSWITKCVSWNYFTHSLHNLCTRTFPSIFMFFSCTISTHKDDDDI